MWKLSPCQNHSFALILQDLRGGGWGRLAAPEDLIFPALPEMKDSWRAFALQTSLLNAECVSPVIYTSYAVVGFGEAKPPRDRPLSRWLRRQSRRSQREITDFGGTKSLQTSQHAATA
jgi:hypothetical protein